MVIPPPTQPTIGMPLLHQSRAPQILVGVIIPFALVSIFVAARLYGRAVIVRSWGWDDTFVTISWTFGLGTAIASCLATKYGTGHHAQDLPISTMAPSLKLQFANQLMYQAALASTKFSICLFQLRLFSDRKSRYLVIGTMIYVALYFFPCELMELLQCSPMSAIWSVNLTARCVSTQPCFYISAVGNILGDTWLIAIIVPRIWPLKMAKRQKIALMCVVTSGWLVIVAAIARAIRVSKTLNDYDKPWTAYDVAIWSGIEIAVGLFCVSAPAVKPILKKYLPGMLSSLSLSQNHTYPDTQNTRNHTRSSAAPRSGTVTYINSGTSKTASQAEMGLELRELGGKTNGNANVGPKRSISRTGNRTFWWDKKSGNHTGSDTESMEEMVPSPAEVPSAGGIMKSTSVTVYVQESSNSSLGRSVAEHSFT